jgi:acetyl esterase/lipase
MLRVGITAALLVGAFAAAFAGQTAVVAPIAAAADRPPGDFPVVVDPERDDYPDRRVTFANGVVGLADVTYVQRLHHRPLTLDVYPPAIAATPTAPRPLIVWVHGGAWVTGTPREQPRVLAEFAARGFVVAAIEYRLDGEAHFPAAIHDVKDAIRYLRVHASSLGIDPQRVGIWGASAGGQLSALAATSCGVEALAPPPSAAFDGASDCVQAAVAWYGVHDFRTVPTPPGRTGPAPYLGCPQPRCETATLAFASPAAYVDRTDPPMLLVHGLADTLVAVSQTREFDVLLKQAGVPVDVLLIPDVDHGFVGETPEATRAARNLALNATLEFFERTLMGRTNR